MMMLMPICKLISLYKHVHNTTSLHEIIIFWFRSNDQESMFQYLEEVMIDDDMEEEYEKFLAYQD